MPERRWQADSAQSLTVRPAAWSGVFWAAVAAGVVLALLPVPEHVARWFTYSDKVQHAIAFAILVWLGVRAGYRPWPMLILGLLALGAAIEVMQSFTPTRTAEFGDWLADALGIACGLALTTNLRQVSKRQP